MTRIKCQHAIILFTFLLPLMSFSATGLLPKNAPPGTELLGKLPALGRGLAMGSGPSTIHVLGVMVEFKADPTTDNTTGTGKFGSDTRQTYDLDPRQNDSRNYKKYFEHHLEFARNYYQKISNNRLTVHYAVADVNPGVDPESNHITLPQKMKYYHIPKKQDKESFDEFNLRLTQGIMAFARDALREMAKAGVLDSGFAAGLSDGSDTVRMKDKPYILVFHAGASGLTDGGGMGPIFADSPSDMIDSYIWPTDFKDYNGTEYNNDESTITINFDKKGDEYGIYSKDSSNFISQLLMCSETMNQDKLNFGINGIIVNQIARAMGLPDLWDTKKGVSAVGSFCLMDVGGYNTVSGFVPVMPSAWCRVKMGWTDPVVAEPDSDFHWTGMLPSTLLDSATVIKIPLSSTEYYLLENRSVAKLSDSTCKLYTVPTAASPSTAIDSFSYNPYDTIYGSQVVMTADSLCLDTPNCNNLYLNPKKAKGLVIKASSYDFGLPGFGGVLVWHIDDQVIREKLVDDGVNNYINRRGVNLEEADGVTDIGAEFVDFLGQAMQSYGSPEDFFPHYESSTGKYINQMTPFNAPTANSNSDRYFSTHTNTGGYTGITLSIDTLSGRYRKIDYTNIYGKPASSYTADSFRISVSWMPGQGNWPQYVDSNTSPRNIVSIDTAIYTLSDSGIIYGFLYNGKRLFADTVLSIYRGFSSPSVMGKAIVFTSRDKADSSHLLLHTFDVNLRKDSILAIIPNDTDVSTQIAFIGGDTIVFGAGSGKVYRYTGGLITSIVLDATHSVSSIAVDAKRLLAVCGNTVYKIDPAAMVLRGNPGTLPFTAQGRVLIAAGDIAAKYPGIETVVNDAGGNVALLDSSLGVLPGWPFKIDAGGVAVPPALGDVDGDGQLDIVIPGNNMVYVLNSSSVAPTGWPHIIGRRESVGVCTNPASLSDIDNDNAQEVFVPVPNGNIVIIDNNGEYFEFSAGARLLQRSLSMGGNPGMSCIVKNIDHDTAREIPEHIEIFSINKEGYLSGFNVPLSGSEKTAWETDGGRLGRTNFYSGPSVNFRENRGSVAIDTFFTYPNPVRGNNSITAKYILSGSADKVSLKLYNSAGDRLIEKNNLTGNEHLNQAVIDIGKIAPGMYTLKIEAIKSGKSFVKFTKVGIIK